MSSKSQQYAHQCIAGSGFAIINSVIAWRLRPDLWASGQDCAMSMGKLSIDGAKKLSVTIQGLGNVLVLAMSEKRLAERIEEVTGFAVTRIEAYEDPAKAMLAPAPTTMRHEVEQHLEKLRNLAAMEPPSWACSLRTDILNARAQLARMDLQKPQPKPTSVVDVTAEPIQPEADIEQDDQSDTPETAIDRSKQLLLDMLSDGPAEAASIMAVAEGDGLSERTMQRAAADLGVVKSKAGFAEGWTWALPETEKEAA